MSEFALKTSLPSYLREWQEIIMKYARGYGLDFFPVVFEILTYDQMNEIAAYLGFPNRYPHWRFGMEYEQLSKSYEYGLSKIYEMVINNNPSYAYLLEGNSLTEQKLVMAHVLGHVDFFKNNFAFRATDLDARGRLSDPMRRTDPFDPNRKWVDKMANNGSRIRRHMDRHGVNKVEEFIDACLSLENLIDPWRPFAPKPTRPTREELEEPAAREVPRLRAKGYMEKYINPDEYIEEQKKKMVAEAERERRFPDRPERDVLRFLLDHAPLERWERDALEVIREEAYYFVPQMQTKIMNEGWASYWHSRLMTEKIADATEIIDYADRNASVMATGKGQINPYKLGVELLRHIEERWDKGQFGREWEECDDLDAKRHWDLRLGLGRQKIFEVRRLYTDVTFLDEFLTPEFAIEQKLFTFSYSNRNDRFEIESREFKKVKDKLLFQLTNSGNPVIFVHDANFENRGELLLKHEHAGLDLRVDYAKETLKALQRMWRRPVAIATTLDNKSVLLRYDGAEHTSRPFRL
ncbi:MAG TPA: SpoVR family protein [Polyangiaceae bacterium]|nr:SpoVR family protein [Polyangiaceae bacterium]